MTNRRLARFIRRKNRFVVECNVGSRRVEAYLPNPGRLHELLLPGRMLVLVRTDGAVRLSWKVVGIIRGSTPVLLDTHHTNAVARELILGGHVAALRGWQIAGREITHGHSRFDFLLEKKGHKILLEVKSCTLFSRSVAMFPDAVSARATRHIKELAGLGGDTRGAVMFVINSPRVRFFLPEYHTDPEFARALYEARKELLILPVKIGWNEDLTAWRHAGLADVPWHVYEREGGDGGAYVLCLRLSRKRRLQIGRLGSVSFPRGWYLYVGSAKKNLTARLARHRRTRKKLFWHVDYLRQACDFLWAMPVRTSQDVECELARALGKMAETPVAGFGSSDCNCRSHLFRLAHDPLEDERLLAVIEWFKMERPLTHVGK